MSGKETAAKAVRTKSEKYLAQKLKLDVPRIPTKGRTKTSVKPEKKFAIPALQTISDEEIRDILLLMGHEEIDLKSACLLVKRNYHTVWSRINSSEELRNLDRNMRNLYLKGAVRRMNELAVVVADPQRARLMCDNIKWEASRVLRHEFGDHVTVAGDQNAPLITKLVVGADEIIKKLRAREVKDDE